MQCKWFSRKERQEIVSETSEFKSKFTKNLPKGAPVLEQFLTQTQKDISPILQGKVTNSNLSKEGTLQCVVCKVTEVSLLNQQKRGLQW